MKKFIIKVVAYVLTLSLITIVINKIYVKLDHSNDDYTKKFMTIPNDIEVCNFGSSHGLYGYNYEDIEDDYVCFNFALVSQTLSYDYRLMQYYQDNLKKGCIVFINVSYFSLLGNDEVNNSDFESKNKRYYKILSKKYIKQYDVTTDFYVDKMPALEAGVNIINDVLGKLEDNTYSDWDQTADTIDLEADAEAANLRHFVTNKLDDNGNFVINQEEISALYDMIEMCYEKEWIPIIITTPFLLEYSSKAYERSPEVMNWLSEIMDTVVENTGARYFDYSLDSRFSNRYDWFMNGDHMNREGAREFVDILNNEIIKNINN
jgi:hypothetical protein